MDQAVSHFRHHHVRPQPMMVSASAFGSGTNCRAIATPCVAKFKVPPLNPARPKNFALVNKDSKPDCDNPAGRISPILYFPGSTASNVGISKWVPSGQKATLTECRRARLDTRHQRGRLRRVASPFRPTPRQRHGCHSEYRRPGISNFGDDDHGGGWVVSPPRPKRIDILSNSLMRDAGQ
jgi:hypothetical protein